MRISARRVASRYLEALVVPPRRDREFAMYHAFLKSMRQDLARLEAAKPLVERASDVLPFEGGAPDRMLQGYLDQASKSLSAMEKDLGGRKDIPVVLMTPEDATDRQGTRQYIQWGLEQALKELGRYERWADGMARALEDQDFDDEAAYIEEPLSPGEMKQLKALPAALQGATASFGLLLKRMARLGDPSMGGAVPASAEAQDLETLYHASVNARQLAQSGFSLTMPEGDSSAGLGGSQSTGGGKKGVSFTEDAYVAKEIARVLKEVAMIARGEVKATEILDWASRSGQLSRIIDWYGQNYSNMDRMKERLVVEGKTIRAERYGLNQAHLDDVKAGRSELDPKLTSTWAPVPLYEVLGSDPVTAMGLYLSYLNFSGRYDPKFFGVGPKGLVARFKGLNPKNIGYITATINMADPHITYGKGEREFRVPPEAILSVDRFIG